jgi:hypothetical protein
MISVSVSQDDIIFLSYTYQHGISPLRNSRPLHILRTLYSSSYGTQIRGKVSLGMMTDARHDQNCTVAK